MSFHIYNLNQQRDLPETQVNGHLNDPSRYIPSQGLIHAVNVALALGQPLLLTGEPGTGKTRLAHHVAWIFKLGEPVVFNAQTSSSVRDLFYRYDALGHFQHSQTSKEILSVEEIENRYVNYQGLGLAIRANKPTVVLIDEIDKAPRDLPNDVLAALEGLTFKVQEINKTYEASHKNRPIIIMTSNSEKNLPDPFLRRVTYYHIPFPNEQTLLKILQSRLAEYTDIDLNAVVSHFNLIRSGRSVKLRKNPATAELIHWTLLLQKLGLDTSKLEGTSNLSEDEQELLKVSYAVLAKTREDLNALQNMK